jgi:DNA-binding NarL/FixJ family response regulator
MKIGLAIADNNPIRRDGIRAILQQDSFDVLFTQSCLETLTERITDDINVLIWGTDESAPVGQQLFKQLRVNGPHVKIVVLDNDNGIQPAIKAINAGADAYITQSVQKEELLFAIKYILQGKKYIDPSLTMRLFNKLSDFEDHLSTLNTNLELSEKENEVLDLMVCGYANKDIAYRLFTTKRNIENMRQDLINKTGAKDNLSLILYRLHKEFIQN